MPWNPEQVKARRATLSKAQWRRQSGTSGPSGRSGWTIAKEKGARKELFTFVAACVVDAAAKLEGPSAEGRSLAKEAGASGVRKDPRFLKHYHLEANCDKDSQTRTQ